MPCERLYPVFLMYNTEGQLGAFGWIFQGEPISQLYTDEFRWFKLTPTVYPVNRFIIYYAFSDEIPYLFENINNIYWTKKGKDHEHFLGYFYEIMGLVFTSKKLLPKHSWSLAFCSVYNTPAKENNYEIILSAGTTFILLLWHYEFQSRIIKISQKICNKKNICLSFQNNKFISSYNQTKVTNTFAAAPLLKLSSNNRWSKRNACIVTMVTNFYHIVSFLIALAIQTLKTVTWVLIILCK